MALIGLRNIVVAEIEKDDESGIKYKGEVRRLKGARLVSVSPEMADGALYGDDQLLESESSVTSLNASLELASLSLEDEAFLKGHEYKNGLMLENKDDTAPDIALGFMAPKSKTGGGKFRMVWLTSGSAIATDEEVSTKEDSIEYQTPTLDFTFKPRIFDGQYRLKADTDVEGAPTQQEFFSVEYLERDHTLDPDGSEIEA